MIATEQAIEFSPTIIAVPYLDHYNYYSYKHYKCDKQWRVYFSPKDIITDLSEYYYERVLVCTYTNNIDYPRLGRRPLPSSSGPALKLGSYSQEPIEHEAEQSTSRASLSTVYTKDKLDEEEEPF